MYANKKDDNHAQIVKDLLKIGFSVIDTTPCKDKALDIIIALHGETAIVEIKNGKNNLEVSQSNIFKTWQGKKILARCTADILKEFGLVKSNDHCPDCGNLIYPVYFCDDCKDLVKPVKK